MPEIDGRVNVVAAGADCTPEAAGVDGPVLVYATFPSVEAARRIGAGLVEAGVAACVNILPGMMAIYRWQGAINQDAEAVMIIKTRRRLAERVVGMVRVGHSYTNPALVVLPVIGGSADFLAWIEAETEADTR